jgi:hypothetical protein
MAAAKHPSCWAVALNAVAGEGVPLRNIAEAIGRRLCLPVAAIRSEDAGEHFGSMAAFVAAQRPGLEQTHPAGAELETRSARAHRHLEAGQYFKVPQTVVGSYRSRDLQPDLRFRSGRAGTEWDECVSLIRWCRQAVHGQGG